MGRTPENPVVIKREPSIDNPSRETNWVGITVKSETEQPENYLWWKNYQGDLSNPRIRDNIALFIATIELETGIKARVGYAIDATSIDTREIKANTNLREGFGLYIEEARRTNFSFGVKMSRSYPVEEDPDRFVQAFKRAQASLPDVPVKKPRRPKRDRAYELTITSMLMEDAIDADEGHTVYEKFNPDATLESPRDRIVAQIPVDQFIQRFEVTDEQTIETLRAFPTLCYLLGRVTDKPQTKDSRPDGVERDVWYLTEGSGMFGLKNPEDAMRWKGMFNHSVGTARQIPYVTKRLQQISPEQRREFEKRGFDFSEFDQYGTGSSAELFRDTFLSSHLSRRGVDERTWHELTDEAAHPKGTTSTTAENLLLNKFKAPLELWALIRKVEAHSEHMIGEVAERGYFDNILDAMLTYCDWTFGQKTISLDERFPEMTIVRKDLDPKMLETFRIAGKYFEEVFNEVLQTDTLQELKDLKPEPWETQIREAYCSPSGLTLKEVFPDYPVAA